MKLNTKKLSLRSRILIMTTLILLGLLVCQIIYFRYVSIMYFDAETKQRTNRIVENIKEDIDSFSNQLQTHLSSVYHDRKFMTKLKEKNFDYKDRLYAHDMVVNSSIMSKVYALYIYDNTHTLVSSYRKSSSLKNPFPNNLYGNDNYEEKMLKKAVKEQTEEMSILGYAEPERMNNTVRYIYRLYQNHGSSLAGYLVCDYSRNELDQMIEKSLFSEEQYLWLETSNGYPVNLRTTQNPQIAEVIQAYQNGNKGYEDDYYDFEAEGSVYGYTVHSLAAVSYLEKNSKDFLRNVIGMISILVLIWGSVLFLSSKKMTQQLTMMMDTIQQVKDGNIHIRFTNLRDDELGKLGKQFNHMMDEIEDYIYREYQSRIILNDAKYYALQAQINPHFLFNTLNTMAGIAGVENCDKVQKMCYALSDIFRYNIAGNMDKKFVTIKEELEHIRNYLYIVQMRTMDEIKFLDNVPETLCEIQIPKLSIQPLVENSINHGLKNKKGKK